jgi:hypothetical protein
LDLRSNDVQFLEEQKRVNWERFAVDVTNQTIEAMIEKDNENRLFSNGEVILLETQIHHAIQKSTEMFRMGVDGLGTRNDPTCQIDRSIDSIYLPRLNPFTELLVDHDTHGHHVIR